MNLDEQIPLHSLNCLPVDEIKDLEKELNQSESLQEALSSFQPAVEALGLLAEPVTPPASLKARMRERLQDQRPQQATSPELRINQASERQFKAFLPGISKSILRFDPEAQRVTMLLKVEAGARLPAHRHLGPEECLVLSGDLRGQGFILNAGDYQLSEAHSTHGELWSEMGCTALIMSSTLDSFIEEPTT